MRKSEEEACSKSRQVHRSTEPSRKVLVIHLPAVEKRLVLSAGAKFLPFPGDGRTQDRRKIDVRDSAHCNAVTRSDGQRL